MSQARLSFGLIILVFITALIGGILGGGATINLLGKQSNLEENKTKIIEREIYKKMTEDDSSVIFPTKFFFPFPAHERYIPQDSNYIDKINSYNNENTYCIHMWHVTWQKKK